jgi:hypothetical protein
MAPPIDVAGLRPRLGDVEAPPKPRSSPSPGSGEAEFVVFWGRALGRARRRSSSSGAEPKSEPWVGRGGDRRLLGPSPSPNPGSGEAEIVVFWDLARVRALGRAEFAVFRGLARVRALGRAEFAVFRDLARVRALGRAEFVVFRDLSRVRALGRAERSSSSSGAEPKSEPLVGRSGASYGASGRA